MAGDKGYIAIQLFSCMAEWETKAVIPNRSDEIGDHAHDRAAYRGRPVMERSTSRLKLSRHVASGYDGRADSYLAMATFAIFLERV